MARASTRDMTVGSPTKLIVGFFVPLLFGLLFQQLYNMVDTMVVGKFLGVMALAGVGSTGSLTFLVLGFCIGICNGFAIPVAQKFGERDLQGLKRYVVNGIFLVCVLSVVITSVVCLLCHTMLLWMNTPADIIENAYSYLFVCFLGIPVILVYNMLFCIIRALGDSRTPVIYLVFCSLLNVALDLLLILVFRVGVAGAAFATVISQACSALLCIRYIRHCDAIVLQKEDWKPDFETIKKLLSMGIPTGMQYSITALGSIVLQSSVNKLGSLYVASIATGVKVSQLCMCPFDALGTTMATYGGQNVGAGKLKRISQGLLSCSIMGISYALIAFAGLSLWSEKIALIFVNASETEVIANAKYFLFLNSMMYIPLAFVNILRFLIQGLGFTKQAVFAGVCEMVARIVVAVFLVPVFGFSAACLANPAAWIAATSFLFPTYFWSMRKLRARLEKPTVV